jgi:hypothetical protein
MQSPPPEVLTLMTVAAELRATGNSWEAVGLQVQRSPRTCREWPLRYPDAWKRLYLDAEDAVIAEASSEAMFYLRKLLRAGDPKDPWLQQNTAKFLATHRREARSQEVACAPAAVPGHWVPFIAYLETLSDDQAHAYVQQFVACHVAPPGPDVPPDAGEPGPAVGG